MYLDDNLLSGRRECLGVWMQQSFVRIFWENIIVEFLETLLILFMLVYTLYMLTLAHGHVLYRMRSGSGYPMALEITWIFFRREQENSWHGGRIPAGRHPCHSG